jgi:hypothetical protein
MRRGRLQWRVLVKGSGLRFEHHGDTVAHREGESVGAAAQFRRCAIKLERALTQRADQNV